MLCRSTRVSCPLGVTLYCDLYTFGSCNTLIVSLTRVYSYPPSLLKHKDELEILMTENKIDIISINETKLDDTIRDKQVAIEGFSLLRLDPGSIETVMVEVWHSISEKQSTMNMEQTSKEVTLNYYALR